ncbi:MAG: hypothetical protein AUJ92_03095 [Armatimonadetes bacterium CG2_30_59_28]|nr:N-acetylneuraminate lyase [Armatimonadota bacterium]OIO97712.1 MAG: hypothetical protein AUJ92_03095 [Armatimonadetes bacterium CG2_30_59_28]PIU64137.1 MAG: N-acetylneuraminate lyase [Armatimonadetes bacterium CG07_land_8_20_14_0_80_59_28]PIX38883.1 MAG: N-acetylneuraminate lyase [Armatimonadetes bacterium CG_4_8_14_3_um_filter_58_9]PIY40638.1 MAG: N-acetylneuraminate lyase [Armatimonadetes bacterium CG_4_10_14_3_um_filter_59_10]PJB74644.1 MAG: N-acetylneuraminate lyase [Armatimonadetes bac
MNAAMLEKLRGVFPALITPFTETGTINHRVVRNLVQRTAERGVDGYYVAGSTGEGLLLDLNERKQLLETVLKEVGGRLTVIAHIGCVRTNDAVELARHAAETGTDAISAIPPVYFPVGWQGVELHYRRIAEATELPLIIYNIPRRTGVTIDFEATRSLATIPNIAGMKFSDYNLHQMQLITQLHEGRFVVFNGNDEVFLSGLVAGARGGIGSTYNLMPRQFAEVFRLYHSGEIAAAREVQARINQVVRIFFESGSIILSCLRSVLRQLGTDTGHSRFPIPPLTPEVEKRIQAQLREIGFFDWLET